MGLGGTWILVGTLPHSHPVFQQRRSARSVQFPPMLDPVDDDDLVILEDLVDDPVLAPSGGPEPFQFAEEWLAEPLRVAGDRPQDRLECGGPDLIGKAAEMPETFGCDLDLVQRTTSEVIRQPQPLALGGFGSRPTQRLHQFVVAKDVEAFLERFEVIGTHQHERRPAVSGHQDPVVLQFDAVGQLGEVRLDLGERQRVAHRSEL